MAILIKRNQIDGLVAMYDLLHQIDESYPASKVTTEVVKTPGDSSNPPVLYNAEDLVEELKTNVDNIMGGANNISLPELERAIGQLNAELNGGSYYTTVGGTSTSVLGLKNKPIKDVVRLEYSWIGPSSGSTATLVNGEKTANLTSSDSTVADQSDVLYNTQLIPYTVEGERIVSFENNTAGDITFNIQTGTFSSDPYIIDFEGTVGSYGSNRETGAAVEPDQIVYKRFQGTSSDPVRFKVFPRGKWTIEDLPTNALLDNNELQLIAYDQALKKVVIQLAKDTNLVNRIIEAVGVEAIDEAIAAHSQVIDNRLDLLEGVATPDNTTIPASEQIGRAAVRYQYVQGAPAKTATAYNATGVASTATINASAESVTKTTVVPTKKYVDDAITEIKTYAVGSVNDTPAINSSGYVTLGTAFAEINGIKDKMLYKDKLIVGVKSSLTASQAVTNNTIDEKSLVTKFASVDANHASLRSDFDHFVTDPDTVPNSARDLFVQFSDDVINTFTKVTKVNDTYTFVDADSDHPDVTGIRIFNEKTSELIDTIKENDDSSYKWKYIVTAPSYTAATPALAYSSEESLSSNGGITAKPLETAASQSTAVLSEQYTRYLIREEKERASYNELHIYQDAYLWNNITNGTKDTDNVSVTVPTFNSVTGAAGSDTLKTGIATAANDKTVDEKTQSINVPSVKWTQYRIAEAKKIAELRTEGVRDELLARIAYEHVYAANALAAAVEELNTTIAALDAKTYDWSHIVTASSHAAITDSAGVTVQAALNAETAVSENTATVSKQYVDQQLLVHKAEAIVEAHNIAYNLDRRLDVVEAITPIREKLSVNIVKDSVTGEVTSETFTLSQIPLDLNELVVSVNGVNYYYFDQIFTVARNAKVVTWKLKNVNGSAGFNLSEVLDNPATVVASYNYVATNKLTNNNYADSALATVQVGFIE